MNKKLRNLLLTIALLILIAININVYITHHTESKKAVNNEENEINTVKPYNVTSKEETEQSRKEMLNKTPEVTRMKTYVGRYISYIDCNNYEEAYKLLYDNFKNNYFPTLESFETYAREKYPDEIKLEYGNIEREGTIYVLTVTIKDTINKEFTAITQNFVIQENDLSDYVLSFNVE